MRMTDCLPLLPSLILIAAVGCHSPVAATGKPYSVTLSFSPPSRTVVPNWGTAIASYGITLHCTTSAVSDITATATATSATVSNVPPGTWSVTVTALNSSLANIGAGAGTVTVSPSGTSTSVSIPISATQSGTGGYSFGFEFPPAVGITGVSGQLYDKTGTSTVGSPMILTSFPSDSGTNNSLGTFSNTNIASGSHILQLTFSRGAAVAGVYSEAVNVWDNVTSDQWLDSAGTLHPYRTFTVTDFNSSNSALASMTASVAGIPLALNPGFSSNGLLYTNESPSAVTLIPRGSIVGQTLQCQLNSEPWTTINSGMCLNVAVGSTAHIKVTSTDGGSSNSYSYSVTPLNGVGTPLNPAGTVSTLGVPVDGFLHPAGVASDGTNIYVADTGNKRICKLVISSGVFTTLATDFSSPKGVATDGTYVYVADSGSTLIQKILISSGVVSTLASGFASPQGVATDGIYVYVADNNQIRQVLISTGAVTTLAGGGSPGHSDGVGAAASFYGPTGVCTDGTNLYVADTNNYLIRQIVIATGCVTTLAGGGSPGHADGTGSAATFNVSSGLVTDGTNLYVVDTGTSLIRKIVIATGVVTTLAGSGYNGPTGLTTDGTFLYVADTSNSLIKKIQ